MRPVAPVPLPVSGGESEGVPRRVEGEPGGAARRPEALRPAERVGLPLVDLRDRAVEVFARIDRREHVPSGVRGEARDPRPAETAVANPRPDRLPRAPFVERTEHERGIARRRGEPAVARRAKRERGAQVGAGHVRPRHAAVGGAPDRRRRTEHVGGPVGATPQGQALVSERQRRQHARPRRARVSGAEDAPVLHDQHRATVEREHRIGAAAGRAAHRHERDRLRVRRGDEDEAGGEGGEEAHRNQGMATCAEYAGASSPPPERAVGGDAEETLSGRAVHRATTTRAVSTRPSAVTTRTTYTPGADADASHASASPGPSSRATTRPSTS